MQLAKKSAEVFILGGLPEDEALSRTTHMAISAHPDDIEIMALEGILACFQQPGRSFTGVIVSDGAGSARTGPYADYTDEQMVAVRRVEQKKAAAIGEYGAMLFLDHPTSEVKDPTNPGPASDIKAILSVAHPEVIYTHNLADKHPTHVSVALRVLEAIRSLPREQRPARLVGCEVWRDLDWMVDADKIVFRLDEHESLGNALVGVFDSQVTGGKRYDLATQGRRRAHATYFEALSIDASQLINFGMDLTPLIEDDTLDPAAYVQERIDRFAAEVRDNLRKLARR